MRNLLVLAISLLICSALPTAACAEPGPNMQDPCYSPTQPLTPELRRAFVDEVKVLAVKAERDHGVPAVMIAAMSINESGYGTTKLAIATHNILSWKSNTPTSGPGGRAVFELTCQPASDVNNKYIVFRDRADSADFVAGRFATSPYYKAATDAYRGALAGSADPKAAAIIWFRTIAPTYNPYHTDDYIAEVLGAADDPISRSGNGPGPDSLWPLAPSQAQEMPVAAGESATPPSNPRPDPVPARHETRVGDLAAHIGHPDRRYLMSGDADCTPVAADDPIGANPIVAPYVAAASQESARSRGVRILACNYKYRPLEAQPVTQEGFAVLIDLPAAVLADWIVTACETHAAARADKCARVLADTMLTSNGGQYVIAGWVAEGPFTDVEQGVKKQSTLCKQRGKEARRNGELVVGLIAFRYGVTVQFKEVQPGINQPIFYCVSDPLSLVTQKKLVLESPVESVYAVGRVAALNRANWPSNPKPKTDPTPDTSPSEWQKVVHGSMLNAMATGKDALFEQQARMVAASGSR